MACPYATTYTTEMLRALYDGLFDLQSVEQAHIFPYVVEKYVNYEYELQPWFKAMPRGNVRGAGAPARLAHADHRPPDLACRPPGLESRQPRHRRVAGLPAKLSHPRMNCGEIKQPDFDFAQAIRPVAA